MVNTSGNSFEDSCRVCGKEYGMQTVFEDGSVLCSDCLLDEYSRVVDELSTARETLEKFTGAFGLLDNQIDEALALVERKTREAWDRRLTERIIELEWQLELTGEIHVHTVAKAQEFHGQIDAMKAPCRWTQGSDGNWGAGCMDGWRFAADRHELSAAKFCENCGHRVDLHYYEPEVEE